MTGNDNNPIARGEHVTDMLSAYIDGTLDEAERGQVRAHLEGCDKCRAEHAEIVATRAMLRAVPAMQAPRAFTLTPEMARKVRPPSLFERIFVPSNAPRMATASVLSFLLLFFVLVGPLLTSRPATFSKIGYGLSGDGASAPSAAQEQDNALTMSQPAPMATATTGAAAAEAFTAPVGTPMPPSQDIPPNAGGGLVPDVPTEDVAGAPAPTQPIAMAPAPVPTQAAGAAGSDTGTTAGKEAATAVAEARPNTARQSQQPESSFQFAPATPPTDWGAVLASAVPLFLLALGLGLGVMAWIARSNRPA
jgi:anti-sigma factor RsiW